jgi:hypothetical protein
MQNPVLPKDIPQVLAYRHHPQQLPPIDHIGIRKPPLRPIRPDDLTPKSSLMPLRPPMYLIAFRHPIVSRVKKN